MTIRDQEVLRRLTPRLKLWLEMNGDMVLGKGGALLLQSIEEHGSISQAVQFLPKDALSESEPPSYRFAWGYLRKVEERLGAPIVEKRRGHRARTGGTALTSLGRKLLKLYLDFENRLAKALENIALGK